MPRPIIDQNTTLDYGALTMVQLRGEALRLANVLEMCNTQRQQILDEVKRRLADAEAQNRVSTMTETQKEALRELLGPSP